MCGELRGDTDWQRMQQRSLWETSCRALEGNLNAVECPGLQEDKGCEGAELCVTKYVWQRVNDSITQAVDEIKLDQLVTESKKRRS